MQVVKVVKIVRLGKVRMQANIITIGNKGKITRIQHIAKFARISKYINNAKAGKTVKMYNT